jgi:hypothetical protein
MGDVSSGMASTIIQIFLKVSRDIWRIVLVMCPNDWLAPSSRYGRYFTKIGRDIWRRVLNLYPVDWLAPSSRIRYSPRRAETSGGEF